MRERLSAAVLGATGIVGQRFVEMLSNHPWFELTSLTGGNSAGKTYGEAVTWLSAGDPPDELREMKITESEPDLVDVAIVFSALPSGVARVLEPKFAEAGLPVLSNASTHRMAGDVPLIIPEVNPDHLSLIPHQRRKRGWRGFIVTDPNCSTINLALVLKPIHDLARVGRVLVTTLQAVSGAGYPGVPSLSIIDNVIPYIPHEEEKMSSETRKILGFMNDGAVKEAEMVVEASCTRVPSVDGHLEIINIETEDSLDAETAAEALRSFRGVPQDLRLPTAPEDPIILRAEPDRPQPRLDRLAGSVPGMSVSVGRLRVSEDDRQLRVVALGHNTIRGAAGTSILTAELLVNQGVIEGS